ncbi:MAG TPA: SMP-30/gluconolactonase/LRE family protein [Opitutaceae bacterium]|nr:SMP-30/gluconolactonase/LRE family protein [Opitutaceae bacterium]
MLCAPSASVAQTFAAEWSTPDIGRLGPTGLALDSAGGVTYLYASDQNHGRIIKFNAATGARVAAWGETGNADGQFNSPFGLAIEPTTHDVYVVERANNRIQRITSSGAFVLKWGVGGSGPGELNQPVGIAADAAGNVYVTDRGNHRVHKFHVQGSGATAQVQHVMTWGGQGSGHGQFDGPYGITLDAAGNLWVADTMNHRLQKFDTNGNFLGAVGSFGSGNGQFINPTWVAFDATGAYFVTETNSDPQNVTAPDIQNQRIQKFSASGAFLMKWGVFGEVGGAFRLPFSIVIDAAGNSYVADYYNTRVQKFTVGAPTPPPPPPSPVPGTSGGRFVNLSSRLRTIDGNTSRAFIAGFVVSGTTPKQMLVRAAGPSLGGFGVSGALANPKLRIFAGSNLLAENDDWGSDAAAASAVAAAAVRVGAFAFAAGSRDAALLVTLPPGIYTAQVMANGGDGVGLVEVYDAEAGQAATQLINLSTRGFVDTGAGQLVAGFVVSGDQPKRVLVRGIGPALAQFGVAGTLGDAQLKVFRGDTLVAQNDDWQTVQTVAGGAQPATAAETSAAAAAAGAFTLPGGGKDAALVITLQPGAYSAVVSGANNTTGAGLVEVYELKN